VFLGSYILLGGLGVKISYERLILAIKCIWDFIIYEIASL